MTVLFNVPGSIAAVIGGAHKPEMALSRAILVSKGNTPATMDAILADYKASAGIYN
ncbi:hypothetical protein I2I11_17320 [Pontibacter sp. 172403-2]|uniref:hypothetical protein n=1 Tax=Pontibacter rufus TaxID=2791028 RepID=UPI0018AF5C74|nr:hypothetical protein [Pontibacter sp. 172403-2]MBF9255062.1 hypothetical protein [Pontibacter sp. 172403-2]